MGSKSRGFLDSLRGSSNSTGSLYNRMQDVPESDSALLRLSDDDHDQDEPRRIEHSRSDSYGQGRPVGLLAAAYNNEPLPDVNKTSMSSSSGWQLQPTTKPWQPGTRARPSTFDQYGTFPDLLGDQEEEQQQTQRDEHHITFPTSAPSAAVQRQTEPYDVVPLFVVPLFRHQLVVIPVPVAPPEVDQKGPEWLGKVVQTGQAVQKKAAETWDSLKNSEPDSIKNKVYRAGQAQLENLSPEQRLLGGIPDYAKKLKVIHAPKVDAEEVVGYMSDTIKKLGTMERVKQIGTATLLPFTFMLDSIVLPGPAILTGITGYKCYHYSKAAAGSQRLKKFVDKEEGVMESAGMSVDDMDFVLDHRITKYYNAERDEDGVLLESIIDEMAAELECPELGEIAHQLRRQHLRTKGKLPVYDSNVG